jgi:hypothetical protein
VYGRNSKVTLLALILILRQTTFLAPGGEGEGGPRKSARKEVWLVG